jgi:CIC family chloride channel protein
MAATLGHLVGKTFRRDWPDCRVLLAAGAGAGLATAFNAPIACVIFVLEELVRRFELRIAIAALGASASAISVSRAILGDSQDFQRGSVVMPDLAIRPLFFVLGALAGVMAVIYNRVLLQTMATLDRFDHWPVEIRAALIGAGVGALAWFLPDLVGGGDPITQRTLLGSGTLAMLPLVFLMRLALGSLSYSAGTRSADCCSLLVLGAQFGLFFGLASSSHFGLHVQPEGFAVVGMAALFTGIVRAALTGIVLATEMTADVTMLLPMVGACAMAMLTPAAQGSADLRFVARADGRPRESAARTRGGRGARARVRSSDVRHENLHRRARGSRDMAEAQRRRFSDERRGRRERRPYLRALRRRRRQQIQSADDPAGDRSERRPRDADDDLWARHGAAPPLLALHRRHVRDRPRRANRATVKQYAPDAMNVVGLALREDKKLVDKITKGARMHA